MFEIFPSTKLKIKLIGGHIKSVIMYPALI